MTRTKTRALANWPNNAVSVLDYGAVGDGSDESATIQNAIASAVASNKKVIIPFDTTLNLAPGNVNAGQIVDCVEFCGYKLTINFTAGCVLAEQIIADHKDASWITLTGDDAFTPVDKTSFTRTILEGSDVRKPLIGADNGSTPFVNHRFQFPDADKGTKEGFQGVCAINNSSAQIGEGAGITNCPDVGALASNGSTIVCPKAEFVSCGLGIMAFRGSTIEAEGCIISDCYWYGIYVNRNSNVNFQDGSCTYTVGDNVRVIRCSTFNADKATITNGGKKRDGTATGTNTTNTTADMIVANPNNPMFVNIYALSSTVRALSATLTYAQEASVLFEQGSSGSFQSSTLSESKKGAVINASTADLSACTVNNTPQSAVVANYDSVVNAEGLTSDNCGGSTTGGATIWARNASTINAGNANITNSISAGGIIYSQLGSTVNFVGGTMTAEQSGGAPIPFYGVRAENSSTIVLDGVDARRDKTTDSIQDISISTGSTVSNVGAGSLGGCFFTPNTPASSGIFYSD